MNIEHYTAVVFEGDKPARDVPVKAVSRQHAWTLAKEEHGCWLMGLHYNYTEMEKAA